MPDHLIRGNRAWAEKMLGESPEYFERLAAVQKPDYFWIGCADSRVPANVITGRDPGEIFVHRNVANVVHPADLNFLSTLEFAVEVLGIGKIVVCGHYGCAGVKAASEDVVHGLADHWLEPIRRIGRRRRDELDALGDDHSRLDRLAELNVVDGVGRVAESPIVQRAWRRGEHLEIHGLMYGLQDGLLKNLGCSIQSPDGALF
ncbi:carbonic anhydrase [Wenzhouxiangella sp. EGI_FJ10409]|uniref:carbonic anhydrase n=1 Tax=Wenzhouxiangella sp. EGI_FJ10409 TaxID=3243767 RepID=UPI0035DFEB06